MPWNMNLGYTENHENLIRETVEALPKNVGVAAEKVWRSTPMNEDDESFLCWFLESLAVELNEPWTPG